MRIFPCLVAVFMTACQSFEVYRDPKEEPEYGDRDVDNDGILVDNDCDDTDDTVGLPTTWFLDLDGDLYGDDNVSQKSCEAWERYVATSGDCNDGNASINPGATEVCDAIDNDCEGTVDEGAADASVWYADMDGDGQGSAATVSACEAPVGYVGTTGDCMDTDPAINSGVVEVCDGIDQNCDGNIDEGVTTTFYADTDGDGYGNMSVAEEGCEASTGYVSNAGDCNDANNSVSPAATETCNGIDDNCDGSTDPSTSVDASTWYSDVDGDGYGDASNSSVSCSAPLGTVSESSDCDDTDASVNPGASEVCDSVDNDCDGFVDPSTSVDAGTWYLDADEDSFGDASASFVSCTSPVGYVADWTDCDDGDSASYPGATEVCDGADNDCDGNVDENDAADASTWYADADGDTYGDVNVSSVSCEVASGYVSDSTDCNDADATVNPGASEACNEVDDDCDGEIDEDVLSTFYADTDADGYGDASVTEEGCEASSGYVSDWSDCNDVDASVNPGASEACNDVDDDCDGLTDDEDDSTDASTMSTWYADTDADTFGNSWSSTMACDQPDGYVSDATDCDDNDVSAYPDAPESCDSVDNDCDGSVDENLSSEWFIDADGDLFGDGEAIDVICGGDSAELVDNADDCDDADASVNPDASEVCNEVDDDCDGSVDEGVQTTFYADDDGDGYGDVLDSEAECSAPSGYVEDGTDCDDTDASVNPSATEIDTDGIDNDCDGGIDDLGVYCCLDDDGDGYGDGSVCSYEGTGVCDTDYVVGDSDCDDGNPTIFPGAYDSPYDGIDADCDTRED
jgi:large repetitive protein